MSCGCGKAAARAARGKEIVGYLITWPDGTTTPPKGSGKKLLTRLEAQVELRRGGGGGTAKGIERSIA